MWLIFSGKRKLKKTIPLDEIKFNPASYVDPGARVFEWQGDIYRAISIEEGRFYRSLFESKFFENLQQRSWIINTSLTENLLEGYAFVIKHERVPFISYCVEWPAVMLKEAALLTLDICQKLAAHNMSLQDAYPWNIYFNYTRPVFIDVSSIVPAPQNLLWTPYQQFCQFFLYPLYLASAGSSQFIRPLLFNYLEGITEENIVKLLPFRYKLTHSKVISRVILPFWLEKLFPDAPFKIQKLLSPITNEIIKKAGLSKPRQRFLNGLKTEVESIKLPISKSNWYKYYTKDFDPSLQPSPAWDQKQKAVAEILDKIRPSTVLDIACNRGWYSLLAATKGCKVVSFDKDENCVAQLYLDARERGLKVLPLVMDVLNPTPAFGWNAKQFPSAIDRFQAEMVFALALIHHLVFKQLQNFDRIAETLNAFTRRWVLVEFPLPEDERVREMRNDRCSWYNLDNFINALNKSFEIVGAFDSFPSTRRLILGKKRS